MRKTRVKFTTIGSDEIQIGYLIKDKSYKNYYKVETVSGKYSFCISLLKELERI